jgi:uncharacterized membrane protein
VAPIRHDDPMDTFIRLLDRQPLIFAHLMCALGALALGAYLLWGRKGDRVHRWAGWTWVLLMLGAALSAAFIRDYRLPNIAGFTPIHAFVVLVLWQLPRGVWYARHGRLEAHRQTMRGLYKGGCLVAGAFTLLPGRFLGTLLWKDALGLMA